MDIYHEPIYYQNEQLRLKVWKFNYTGKEYNPPPRWHYHKEVEFLLTLQGVHEMWIPDQVFYLKPGDVWLVGSNQLHRGVEQLGEYVEYIVLHVDLEPYFDPATMHYRNSFMERLHPLDHMNQILEQQPAARQELGHAMLHIHREVMEQRKGYELAVSMHIKQLLLTLLRYDSQDIISSYDEKDTQILHPIFRYIDAHMEERIDMTFISESAGMSYVYFSKYFKQKTGFSFTEYVNRKRVDRAKQLLTTTDRKITDIALSVGIENMAHFYELFKRFNDCTPRQFKTKMRRGGMDSPQRME